jgi:phospholipase C
MRSEDEEGRRGGTPQELSRRRLLQGATATVGFLTFSQGQRIHTAAAQAAGLPQPEASGIEHVVWVMMENRSFDHFLGWVPQADGRQAGLAYPDRTGVLQPTHRLAPDFQGCGHPDPDHGLDHGGGHPSRRRPR